MAATAALARFGVVSTETAWEQRGIELPRKRDFDIADGFGAGLAASLVYIKEVGVASIQAYRRPMIQRLRDEVPRRGFECVTPPESTAS